MRYCPQVCQRAILPTSAPREVGSLPNSRSVSEAALNRLSYTPWGAQGEGMHGVRPRTGDLAIRDGPQLVLPVWAPSLLGQALAVGAVALPTGRRRPAPRPTAVACRDVPPERGGPAARDSPQDLHYSRWKRVDRPRQQPRGAQDVGPFHPVRSSE
jgi:hypothetical protein